jgi:hypothetical protein
MKLSLASVTLTAGLLAFSFALAQAPAAPAGSTGLCKDGSYTSNATKKGACAGHKGVKSWFGEATAAEPAAKTTASAPAAAAPAQMKPMTAAPAPAPTPTAAAKPAAAAASTAPAPGGGPGQVWVNTDSKVYHCPGTKYYGTTKKGEYMTEAAAKAAGSHADHGKACSS